MMEQYRIDENKGLEIGLYTLGDHVADALTGKPISERQRIQEIIAAAKLAEDAGLDVFGVGESHQAKFITSAASVVLGAIANATEQIKLISSATVLSTADPVRVHEEFSTLDLLSGGRAEIVAGRGSRLGAYELFGYDVRDYEELFEEKIELLMKINNEKRITWEGQFRPALNDMEIFPKPLNGKLPIWRAVGGPPASAVKAGRMGIPMMLAVLGGPASAFKTSVNMYRQVAAQSGFNPAELPVGTTTLLYIDKDSQQAFRNYYPYLNHMMKELRGSAYPKDQFAEAMSVRNALLVGSPQQVIEKILYQHELYGHNRFLAQIDIGGLPYAQVEQIIDLLGSVVAPAVRRATAKK
ncbi:LLM class flavin-dependent oxidoreductase [Paenibacillus sp. FSL H8-0315]|uniref:LLM class flavin-dependent oxidoreductase n=1 Tax=Paenibacillus sp. FSL H8-0315 TaxID=2921384 RepID=UPI0030F4EFC1